MTLKKYLLLMFFATLFCLLSFIFILKTVNPENTNWIGFTLFYSSLSLFLIGASSLLGFLIRFVILKKELAFYAAREAFRQSFLFTLLVIVGLALLAHNLFDWINLILLISSLSVLEFLMLSYSKNNNEN